MSSSPVNGNQTNDANRSSSGPLFACKADTTDILTTLLSTLLIDKPQIMHCTVLPAGIKFQVEKDRVLIGKAYLKKSCFQNYVMNVDKEEEKEIKFAISLTIFLECLQVFGPLSETRMVMSYAQHGGPVNLVLEEVGTITTVEIKTLEIARPLDLTFSSSQIIARAVIKSSFLRDCFTELEVPGGIKMSITMTDKAPYLSMSVIGDCSSVQIDFPSDENASDVFTEFECKFPITMTYPLNLTRPCTKALARADHTNLRINQSGMLSMQHVIAAGNTTNWVEFLISAQEDED